MAFFGNGSCIKPHLFTTAKQILPLSSLDSPPPKSTHAGSLYTNFSHVSVCFLFGSFIRFCHFCIWAACSLRADFDYLVGYRANSQVKKGACNRCFFKETCTCLVRFTDRRNTCIASLSPGNIPSYATSAKVPWLFGCRVSNSYVFEAVDDQKRTNLWEIIKWFYVVEL